MSKRTQLSDYVLRFDGTVEAHPDKLCELLSIGIPVSKLQTTEMSEDVIQFNVLSEDQILLANLEEFSVNTEWCLPPEYLAINLDEYFASKTQDDDGIEARINNELQEVHKRGLDNFFRTIIYVIDVFKEKKIVWGVGRGSSCASYLLYLIGLHLVNPIKYNIPYSEFFHD